MKFVLICLTALGVANGGFAADDLPIGVENMTIHVVERGDSLMTISNRYYGTHQKWRDILRVNHGVDAKKLILGQELFIPEPQFHHPIVHKVARGEDLMVISNYYYGTHQKWQLILTANPGINPNVIMIGTKLKIPNANRSRPLVLAPPDNQPNEKLEKKSSKVTKKVSKSLPKELPEETVKRHPSTVAVKPKAEERERDEEDELKEEISKLEDEKEKLEERVEELEDLLKAEKQKDRSKEEKKLEEAYLNLKIELQKMKEERQEASAVEKENKDLLRQVAELKRQLAQQAKSKQNSDTAENLKLYSSLTSSQNQVLQEKIRLLNQRFWVEVNQIKEKCTIMFVELTSKTRERIQSFISFLGSDFGSDRVFLNQSKNELVVVLPGQVVYGVNQPKVRSTLQNQIIRLSDKLWPLPIQSIEIIGHSHSEKIKDEKNRKSTDYKYMLGQSIVLRDFLVSELGWSPKKVFASTFGASRIPEKKYQRKRFEMVIRFADPRVENTRSPASVQTDSALTNLGNEILGKLNEPKYAHVDIGRHGLDVNLGLHYFVSKDRLTTSGKAKLKTLLNLFSLASDSTLEFIWVPGVLERDYDQNVKRTLQLSDQFLSYLTDELAVPKGRIKFGFKSRHSKLKTARSERADMHNRRLIVRVQPNSFDYRNLEEVRE